MERRHQEESSGRWDNSSVCVSRMPALHQVQGESQIDPARVDSMSSIGEKKNLIFLIPERKEDSPKTEKDHGDCREPLQVSLELGMRSSFLGHCADVVFLEQ